MPHHHNALATVGLYAIAVALLVLALAISTHRPAPGHVDHAYWCAATQWNAAAYGAARDDCP